MPRWLAWFLALSVIVLFAVSWWYLQGPAVVLERIQALRANRTVLMVDEACARRARGPRDWAVWLTRIDEAEKRAPFDEDDPGEVLDAFEDAAFDIWRRKNWALDDASWQVEGPYLERRAAQTEEVSAVARTAGEYEVIDPCSLIEGSELPGHPSPRLVSHAIEALRPVGFSLLQAARRGDLDLVQRDVEALLVASERMYAPVSVFSMDAWLILFSGALRALESTLPLLAGRVDLNALSQRLSLIEPRKLLIGSLEWERACGLGDLERFARTGVGLPKGDVSFFFFDARRDLDLMLEGFDLALRHVRGEGVSTEDLLGYQHELGVRAPITAMIMPPIQYVEPATRNCESLLALARTALRLLQHGRAGWQDVARELDPWTTAPLTAEELSDGRIELRSVRGGPGAPEENVIKWIVSLP